MSARGRERLALAAGMVTASLVPLNSTLIAVGLPDIADDLGVTAGSTAVLVTTYLVAMAVLQPVSGRLGDRVGRAAILVGGLVGFGLASLGAALAPGFATLLALRVLQAVAGASLIPNVMAMLRAEVSPTRRGRAFGILGGGIGAGAAVGPVLGGWVVEVAGWRGIFLVSVPVAVTGVALVASLRPAAVPSSEARSPALVLLSPVGGTLGDRTDRRVPVRAGTGLGVLAAVALAGAGLDVAGVLVAAVALFGVGMGLASASLQTSALEAAPAPSAGTAAGLLSTSRYVGSISSTAAIAALVGDDTRGVGTVLAIAAGAAGLAFLASHGVARGGHTWRQVPSTAASTEMVAPD